MAPVKESSSKGGFLKRMAPVKESSSKGDFLKRMVPVKENSSKGGFLKTMVPVKESSSKGECLKTMIPVKESSSKGEFLKRMVPVKDGSCKGKFQQRRVPEKDGISFTGTFLYRNHSFQVSISPTIPGQQLRNENKTKKNDFQLFSDIFRYFKYFRDFFTNIRIYLIISSLLCNKLK